MNVWCSITVLILDVVIYAAVMSGMTGFGYDKYDWRKVSRKTKIRYWLLLCLVVVFLMMVVYFIPPSGRIEHFIYKIGAPIIPAFILLFFVGFFAFMSAGESMGAIAGTLYLIMIIIAPIAIWIFISMAMLMNINQKIPY